MIEAYGYNAVCTRVVDGDTIDVELDLGFSIYSRKRIRLAAINTQELNAKDKEARQRAVAAREYVVGCLLRTDGPAVQLRLRTVKTRAGKERQTFGRYVAYVWFQVGESWLQLNKALVDEGHAVWSQG